MIQQYTKAGIPLDTVYLDYSYLKAGSNFQVDTDAFNDTVGLNKTLQDKNIKLVVVVDSAIVADTNDAIYKQGDTDSAFIKSSIFKNTDYNGNLISYRYGTTDQKVVFVDWLNDNSTTMWTQCLNLISTKLSYDGLWLNLNEPIAAVPGEVDLNPTPPPPP